MSTHNTCIRHTLFSGGLPKHNVIPKQLQTLFLDLVHESHRGLKKTKQLLRSKVWFPNIDAKVEDLIKSCFTCQLTSPPVVMSNLTAGPWKKIDLDLSGPYGSNNEYIFAAIGHSNALANATRRLIG